MIVNIQFYPGGVFFYANWEVFIDSPAPEYGAFGRVTTQEYITRPTKRQIRKLKKAHRQLIKRGEQYDCNVYGL